MTAQNDRSSAHHLIPSTEQSLDEKSRRMHIDRAEYIIEKQHIVRRVYCSSEGDSCSLST